MNTTRFSVRKTVAGIAGVALLSVGAAACSSASGDSDTASADRSAPAAVASIPALTGKTTQISLDKGFTDALTTLKLTPGVTGGAKLVDGALVFPITGGNVTVFQKGEVSPYVIGQIQHEGSGLTLTNGATTVKLSNFNVDPGVSRVYGDVAVNGKTAVTSAYLFSLDGRTLKPLQAEGSTAVLEGTQVKISDVAAPLLDKTFKTDAVKAGLLVGIAKITVNTK